METSLIIVHCVSWSFCRGVSQGETVAMSSWQGATFRGAQGERRRDIEMTE
jgi:hypothetical protein